jgi:mevalonate kinase
MKNTCNLAFIFQIMRNIYPGKILLYGEYSIILKHNALAVPFPLHGGFWEMPTNKDNTSLLGWLAYLNRLPLADDYHMVSFEEDLSRGLFFNSSIPQGYGVGSSGALVAAFYAAYAKNPKINPPNSRLAPLKKELGVLESYFHGNSSGTDPLISYLNQSLFLTPERIDKVVLPASPDSLFFFLLDCGHERKTEPLVSQFLHDIKTDAAYLHAFETKFTPKVEQAIHAHREGNFEELKQLWQNLSRLQPDFFGSMIPEAILAFWQKGNAEGHTHLKLCGAGGGGYLLGLSELNETEVSAFYPGFPIIPLSFL